MTESIELQNARKVFKLAVSLASDESALVLGVGPKSIPVIFTYIETDESGVKFYLGDCPACEIGVIDCEVRPGFEPLAAAICDQCENRLDEQAEAHAKRLKAKPKVKPAPVAVPTELVIKNSLPDKTSNYFAGRRCKICRRF